MRENNKSVGLTEVTRSFLDRQKSPVTGLVESYRGSSKYSYDPTQGAFQLGETGYLENQCFIYDAALAVIAYSLIGDYESARKILANLETNFHIPKGDKIGLFNSYLTNRYTEDGRLLVMGIDGDRMHAGPNLWVGMAAYQFGVLSGDLKYFPLCLEIIKWAIHRLPHQPLKDGRRGAISMGSGWGPNWQETFSTEHNLDYCALISICQASFNDSKYKSFFESSALRIIELEEEKKGVIEWLLERVWDSELGVLHVGFNQFGLDTTRALDTATFSILGVGPAELLKAGINPERLIENAERFLSVSTDIDGHALNGFDFTDHDGYEGKRPQTIWIEGSYQMVLAYKEMGQYFRIKNEKKSREYLKKSKELASSLELLIELLDKESLVPSYTSLKPGPKEVHHTFKDEWEIQRGDDQRSVGSVASAVWRLMASKDLNPMKAHSIKASQ